MAGGGDHGHGHGGGGGGSAKGSQGSGDLGVLQNLFMASTAVMLFAAVLNNELAWSSLLVFGAIFMSAVTDYAVWALSGLADAAGSGKKPFEGHPVWWPFTALMTLLSIYIFFGGLAALAFLALFFFLHIRRRRKNQEAPATAHA